MKLAIPGAATAAALLAFALALPAPAALARADGDAAAAALLQGLHYQTGDVPLADAGATLHVQPGFRYLGHDDTRTVLEKLWHNPPDDAVLGLLVPDNAPLDSEHGWAVLVTYSDDGYVSDADAAKVDYDAVLAQMKEASVDENVERKKAGYDEIDIVGWAQPPRYDAAGKRIYWARELALKGATGQHTLNYDIRVLGREGYLSMNAIAGMNDLALVRDGMTRVLPMAEFDAGKRYADYKPGTDKLAAYGLAALVGGGIAAKAGLFAKLGLLLLAMKKFVILGVLAVAAFVKKLFGGKDKAGTVS
jgi:uncharacterized membrane-anchored protein